MEIRIFDVSHGSCAYVIADNRNVALLDCGYNAETGFRPSNYLVANRCTGIEHLVISNYDDDHINDLPNIRNALPINVLYRNRSVDASQLRAIKIQGGPISPSMA